MSVKESMGYAIVCDFPGCSYATGDIGEYGFWGDLAHAVDEWVDADGYAGELGYYCHTHTVWGATEDDDDIDERTPLLPTLDNMFVLAERRIAERIAFAERRALMHHGNRVRDAAAAASRRDVLSRRRMSALGVEVPASAA